MTHGDAFRPDRVVIQFGHEITHPLDDIVHDAYRPGHTHISFNPRGGDFLGLPLPHLSLDFGGGHGQRDRFDRDFGRFGDPMNGSTSRELMDTLEAHMSGINIGKDSRYVTHDELENYLMRVGRNIDPQDRKDLRTILSHFDEIADADGKKAGKGISVNDMNAFVANNWYGDEMKLRRRDYEAMRFENEQQYASMPYDSYTNVPPSGLDAGKWTDTSYHSQPGRTPDTSRTGSVWQHHELPAQAPEGYDQTKWSNPNYHSIKYDAAKEGWDVRKNVEEILPVINQLPNDQAKRAFMEAFWQTQKPVLEANGCQFIDGSRDCIKFKTKEGQVVEVDAIIDFGGKNQIAWQNSDVLPPEQQGAYTNKTPMTPELMAQIKGALSPEQLNDPKIRAILGDTTGNAPTGQTVRDYSKHDPNQPTAYIYAGVGSHRAELAGFDTSRIETAGYSSKYAFANVAQFYEPTPENMKLVAQSLGRAVGRLDAQGNYLLDGSGDGWVSIGSQGGKPVWQWNYPSDAEVNRVYATH